MRFSAYISLILALLFAALGSPIIKWLATHGGEVGISRPGAISFCNILFVGNLCAGMIVALHYGFKNLLKDLKRIKLKSIFTLIFYIGLGGVMTPVLIYLALENTTVANVILLSRSETITFSLLATIIYATKSQKRELIGYSFIIAGMFILIVMQDGLHLSKGNIYALLSGITFALGAVLERQIIKNHHTYTLMFLRNFVGSLVFFWMAVYFYGFHHFADAFTGDLWIAMTVYALFVVILGHITWFKASRHFTPTILSKWTTFVPLLGIAFAYVILNEMPNNGQWIGGSCIVFGLILAQWIKRKQKYEVRVIEKCLAGAS